MEGDALGRPVGDREILHGDTVADATAKRPPESPGVRGMSFEGDYPPTLADQVGQEPREDPMVRAYISAGPTRSYEPGDRRLELGLVRPVALSEPSENRPHPGWIVAVTLAKP